MGCRILVLTPDVERLLLRRREIDLPVEQGLTVAFVESMTTQLQNFPAPPGPTDPYWYILPISPAPFSSSVSLFFYIKSARGVRGKKMVEEWRRRCLRKEVNSELRRL